MKTVIVRSVVSIIRVGCQRAVDYWTPGIQRNWIWAIWGPFLIAVIVTAWLSPVLLGYGLAAHVIYWAVDRISERRLRTPLGDRRPGGVAPEAPRAAPALADYTTGGSKQ